MSYIANVSNSVIDTANIKNILVQGESEHPQIIFILPATLVGLTWYVRGTYLSFNGVTESDAITPVETESEVSVTWDVDSSFTALYGSMQLVVVGMDGEETIVRAVGYINVARDWSGEAQRVISLDLFEQLMAQAEATITKYAYVDETTGNWFNWNAGTGAFENTGVHAQGLAGIRGSLTYSGSVITGTSTTPTAYATGITLAIAGDRYRNTDDESESYQNEYICTLGGDAATALWAYDGNVRGATGATGAGVATGGTINQALVKTSSADHATAFADISTERTATLATGSWSGASAPYSQDITVTGVTVAGKPPIIDVVLSDTYATALLELTAYDLIYRFKVTADDTITAYATAIPATAINIHAKLVL